MDSFNKFHKVFKPIALSNSRFYEKILGKYRKNKMINSGFPILFLYKSRSHEGLQKIEFSIHWLLKLQNSFSCTLKWLEKMVQNSTYTGKQTLMLQSGKTVLNLKILQMENTKRVQDKGIGKCKKHFSVRGKLLDGKAIDSAISVSGIHDKIGARVEEIFLSKKSPMSFSVPVSSSYFRKGSIRLLNKNNFLGTNERSSIQKSVMLTTVSKVWIGISGRKAFPAFERVIPSVKSAISSAKKHVMSVEKTVPVLDKTEVSVVVSPFPMMDIARPVVKAAVPDILSELETEAYGVEVKSVKNLPKNELLLKKMKLFNSDEVFSKKINRDQRVTNSTLSSLKVHPVIENRYKSDYIPKAGSTFSQVYPLLTVSKVWIGVGSRKAFPAFERVIPSVKSAISSAKKHVMSVEKTVPVLDKTEVSVVVSPFPMMDIARPVVKAAVPDILSGLEMEAYGVEVKSVKNLPKNELLLKKMKLFNANEVFSKKISWDRRVTNSTLSSLKVHPVIENRYKSDYIPKAGSTFSQVYPQLSGKKESFPPTAEDLYFFNQRQVDLELKKIKETVSGLEKSVSEKLITASFPEKARTRSAQEISIISEQVYQSIERRIRMEREMKGV